MASLTPEEHAYVFTLTADERKQFFQLKLRHEGLPRTKIEPVELRPGVYEWYTKKKTSERCIPYLEFCSWFCVVVILISIFAAFVFVIMKYSLET